MSRSTSRRTDFEASYHSLCDNMPTAWQSDFLFDPHEAAGNREKQAVSLLRAVSVSVVCGQHFLLHIKQPQTNPHANSTPSSSPSSFSPAHISGETKTDHAKEVELIVNVVRGHVNVSNGIAHMVFTSETTCEQLMEVAKQGQIFIAIDVHRASSRVLRALGEIMSLRATPMRGGQGGGGGRGGGRGGGCGLGNCLWVMYIGDVNVRSRRCDRQLEEQSEQKYGTNPRAAAAGLVFRQHVAR